MDVVDREQRGHDDASTALKLASGTIALVLPIRLCCVVRRGALSSYASSKAAPDLQRHLRLDLQRRLCCWLLLTRGPAAASLCVPTKLKDATVWPMLSGQTVVWEKSLNS